MAAIQFDEDILKPFIERIEASNLSKADKAVAGLSVGYAYLCMRAVVLPPEIRRATVEEAQHVLKGVCRAMEEAS